MHAVLQWCYWVMANSLQPIDCSPPGSSVHVFPGKNNGELPFPTPRNLLYPGIEPVSPWSPALAGKFFTTSTTLEALYDIHAKVFKVIFPINICSKYNCIFAQMPHIQIHVKSHLSVYYCCSVIQSCQTLCNCMDCSMPGFPVLHHILDLAQTQDHWVHDAIQTGHPLSSPLLLPSIFPSIRTFSNESALPFRWSSIGASISASILPMNIQNRFPLGLTGLISLQSKGLSRVFS